MPSSAVSEGKKKKEALADVVEKADSKRKKDKKEEKDEKFCKPGKLKMVFVVGKDSVRSFRNETKTNVADFTWKG